MPVLTRHHPVPVAALPKEIDPESADSVRRFARRQKFPSGEDGRFLFAFIDEEDRYASVRLRHGLAGHREPPALIRCATGLHVLELHAPAVNRIEYMFELIDRDGSSTVVCDPLCRTIVRDPFGAKTVVATSAYKPPTYTLNDPATPSGLLIGSAISSPGGKQWLMSCWTPHFSVTNDCDQLSSPVVLFLDGYDWLKINNIQSILENLTHARTIPPCRAVFLKPAARNEEYAANPVTAAYLAGELPRIIAERIPWPENPRDRIAVGCSLGALCLLHAHVHYPTAFGGLILQSGSFFQPQTDAMELGFPYFPQIASFVSHALGNVGREVARVPIHMTCGSGEENDVNNHIMAEALTRQGFPLTFHHQPDAHNWTCWRDCVGAGLTRLLAP